MKTRQHNLQKETGNGHERMNISPQVHNHNSRIETETMTEVWENSFISLIQSAQKLVSRK